MHKSGLSPTGAGEVHPTSDLELRLRAPNYQGEAGALAMLTQSLADEPAAAVQAVVEVALDFFQADSAGLSILEPLPTGDVFRALAISGGFAANRSRPFSTNASPCGEALGARRVLLFNRPERRFEHLRRARPTIYEALVAPWHSEAVAGAIWVLGHTPFRRFDMEDARLLASFAGFAAMAYRLGAAIESDERAQNERDTLRRLLSVSEEEERKRLSRELHDEAGQHLAALTLGLQALKDEAKAGLDIAARAETLRSVAETLSKDLHSLAQRLRPAALDDFGVEAALAAYAAEWSERCGIRVNTHLRLARPSVPSDVAVAIYRIAQEALTNVAKHSFASHASVFLSDEDGQVVLVVEDDGKGFDESEATHGLGLRGIAERASLIGGALELETSSRGTSLFVKFPIT